MDTRDDLTVLFDEICRSMKKNSIVVDKLKKISYGIQFKVNIKGNPEIMRIYQNGKGIIKYDYSQIKRRESLGMIKKIIEDGYEPCSVIEKRRGNVQSNFDKFAGASEKSGYTDSSGEIRIAGFGQYQQRYKKGSAGYDLGYPVIGTDESGKGDYFGPLVTAGVLVDEVSALQLKYLGVRDSKEMNDSDIMFIAGKIREVCKGRYAVAEIMPERYNELYVQFRAKNENLNDLLAWCHAEVIEEILSGNICKMALVDKFADDRVILEKLRERGKEVEIIQMNRAEQNIAVAAASILARSVFVEGMERLSREYDVRLPKGASPAVIAAGKKYVNKYGKKELNKVAKIHFKTTGQII
ncbi:ribonuclease HIII [Methanoplanus limicola]|uniref:Ribonuclease n=1 Tax=Methanoplanus limicola DSM 2279 TaxID=937775 RepID=H1Z3L6_9EURY|nr:ribonuclease HIII [Methanoplanus limicola]EHQ35615.1 ribonuclease HIII [Methanoplanus limicola DSM 2279]